MVSFSQQPLEVGGWLCLTRAVLGLSREDNWETGMLCECFPSALVLFWLDGLEGHVFSSKAQAEAMLASQMDPLITEYPY